MKHAYYFGSIIATICLLAVAAHAANWLAPLRSILKHVPQIAVAAPPQPATLSRTTSYFVKFEQMPARPELLIAADERRKYGIIEFESAFRLAAMQSVFILRVERATNNSRATDADFSQWLERLSRRSDIAYIEPVPDYRLFCTPNDPQFADQWNLQNILAAGAWSDLIDACDFSVSCSQEIVVAVVDDALLTTHEDLSTKIWTNNAEIAANGIDDDANGYIDDRHGWDVFGNDNNPNPDNPDCTHGTHVGGIIGAATNNALGIASLGFNCRLLPVKSGSCGSSAVEAAYQGVEYAIATQADIISMSWGGGQYSATYQTLFDLAYSQGIICIAAAGNDAVPTPMYPAAYDHVISVGASDINNQITDFSNYGTSIDIMAPGKDILSTIATNNTAYATMSGTSMACPLVSSAAALMLCLDPAMSPDAFEACLTSNATNIDLQNPNFVGQIGAGLMNVAAMVNCLHIPPNAEFSFDPHTYCPNEAIALLNESSGYNITNYQWTFSGGTPATANTAVPPPVWFGTAGTHTISLSVSNDYGSDTYSATVAVGTPTTTLNGNVTTVLGANATLSLNYNGTLPYTLTYTDGSNTYTINNIAESPYYFNVLASDTTVYTLLSASNAYCTAAVNGQGTVNILQISSDICAYSTIFGTNQANSTSGYYDYDTETYYSMGSNPNFGIFNAALGTYTSGLNYQGLNFSLSENYQLPNGDFIRAGGDAWGFNSDWYMVRTDAAGNWLWGKRYECPGRQTALVLAQGTDDHAFIGGWFNTTGGTSDDYGIYKIDLNNGNVMATAIASVVGDDQAGGMASDGAGGVYQLGEVEGSEYLVLLHYDSDLNLIESRRYDSAPTFSLNAGALTRLPDGGLLIHVIAHNSEDGAILRLDDNLDLVWARTYNLPVPTTITSSVRAILGGNNDFYLPVYVLDGAWSNPNSFILHINLDGTMLGAKSYPAPLESPGFLGYNPNTAGYEVLLAMNIPNSASFGDYDFALIRTDANLSNSCLLDDAAVTLNNDVWSAGAISVTVTTAAITPTDVSTTTEALDLFADTPCIECELASTCIDTCAIVASDNNICVGETISFTASCTGATPNNYFWTLNDTLQFATTALAQYTFAQTGTHTVSLLAIASDTCILSASYDIDVIALQGDAIGDQVICPTESVQLIAQGGSGYIWTPTDFLNDPTSATPIANPDTTTTYYVDIINPNGCILRDSLTVWVSPLPVINPATRDTVLCGIDTLSLVLNEGLSPISNYDYIWSPAVGLSCTNCFAPTATITENITYSLQVTNSLGCSAVQTFNIMMYENTDTTLQAQICAGESFDFGGIALTDSGAYTDTLISAQGCDSLVQLVLTVQPLLTTDSTATICAGESFDFGGIALTDSGTYTDTLVSAQGCDSLVQLVLTVQPLLTTDSTATICAGESFDFGGIALTDSGTYTDTLISVQGCDSLVQQLQLNVISCGQAPTLLVPTAFSPNGDGINDVWQIIGSGINSLSVSVYNRWGQVVYTSTDLNAAWNGKCSGRDCDLGVYVYYVNGSYMDGEPFARKGNLTLVR